MAILPGSWIRPPVATDYRSRSSLRKGGLLLILVGIGVAMVAFLSSIIQADRDASVSSIAPQAAWTFGVATAVLITIKYGIALILWGIVRRLWIRIESVKEALPKLMPQKAEKAEVQEGPITTPYGKGAITRKAPGALPIHRMAYALWAPMLIMGVMLVGIVLAGISFLLGSILGSLRQGGGEIQESLGTGVKTLSMPLTAKLFVILMMMGMMVEMVQFGLYIFVATLDPVTELSTIDAYHAWLGPLREAGLGLLLSGIVLALGTIGKILGFQFYRLQELISTGE